MGDRIKIKALGHIKMAVLGVVIIAIMVWTTITHMIDETHARCDFIETIHIMVVIFGFFLVYILMRRLGNAIIEIKTLREIIPICMYCKSIRDDKDVWHKIEVYLATHDDVDLSHGICKDCMKKHHADLV